jgi:CRP-like cAMP-binding protein
MLFKLEPKIMKCHIKKTLKKFELFSELPDDPLRIIAKQSKKLYIEKNSYVFNSGDSSQGLYLLVAGQLQLGVNSTQGIEKIINTVTPIESFGETGLFLKQQLPFYAKAITKSQVVIVPEFMIHSLMSNYRNIARKMQERLSLNLHHIINRIEAPLHKSAMGRLIVYLLEISVNASDAEKFILPTSKNNIASTLNMTPETLSRNFRALHKDGLIDLNGRYVTIVEAIKLRTLLRTISK